MWSVRRAVWAGGEAVVVPGERDRVGQCGGSGGLADEDGPVPGEVGLFGYGFAVVDGHIRPPETADPRGSRGAHGDLIGVRGGT